MICSFQFAQTIRSHLVADIPADDCRMVFKGSGFLLYGRRRKQVVLIISSIVTRGKIRDRPCTWCKACTTIIYNELRIGHENSIAIPTNGISDENAVCTFAEKHDGITHGKIVWACSQLIPLTTVFVLVHNLFKGTCAVIITSHVCRAMGVKVPRILTPPCIDVIAS